MRVSLKKLINDSVVFECRLPCSLRKIDKSFLTVKNDDCYKTVDSDNLVKIIYNSILEYSYDSYQLEGGNHFQMFTNAFGSKFKYNHDANIQAKKKLGIYGEALLHCILHVIYKKDILISRGTLFDPLAKSETKGYDSYHLIEYENKIHLWFGEAKFYSNYKYAINKVLENISNALSDEYLKLNLISISNRLSHVSNSSLLYKIFEDWNKGKCICLIDEIKKHNIKLIYPIFIIFKKDQNGYNASIENIINYINNKESEVSIDRISVKYSVFFIFLPIDKVDSLKLEVIKWIESNQPLLQ